MVKSKYIAVAVLLFCCASLARGQCTGQYANDPTYAMLIPKDYAAQGDGRTNVTATILLQADVLDSNGNQLGVWGHSGTFTAGGTKISFKYLSNNGSTAQLQLYDNGNLASNQSWSLNASTPDAWVTNINEAGHNYVAVFTVANNGQTTMDRAWWSVTAGNSPGIIKQDGLDTNFYQQVTTTFGGSSMLTSCQECQAGTTQHCINAVHTPYSTIQITNSNSGESQIIQMVQAGNVAKSNESLTGSASLAISVLPGDSGTISIDDKIICSMDGVIFEQTLPKPKTSPTGGSWFPRETGELAFTKVALKVPTHCTPLLDPNGNTIGLHCDVAYYCSARSSPPDYQPTGLKTYHYTNPALVPQFWMSMAPGTALVFGSGANEIVVWYFPFADLNGVLTNVGGMDPLLLDILSPAWVSDSSTQDCTKYISGISPWYMPRW